MNKVSVQIKRSLQEQMLQFNIDWSLVCNQAIEKELKRLSNKIDGNNLESLIDIDITHNNSEIANFNSPEFPRKVYQVFKNVWHDCFSSTFSQKKPPTSQQIKQLWKSWYSPFFDEAEWWESWDNSKRREIEQSASNAYTKSYQYTTLDEQNEFLLDFDVESLNYDLDPIYTAFIEFASKFIFDGELVEINNLTPFHFKSVDLKDKDSLPEEPGIYFVIDKSNVYYIGMTTNLQKRWYSHHKQSEIDSLSEIKISYLNCLPKHYLKNLESTLINHFKPSLNILENPLYKKIENSL
ncbi:MAG: GIY-YIG nuclease family protein [Cyanobacteria bacterium P01_G01_bin.39]